MMEHRTTISIPALSSLDLAFQSLPICRSRARFRAPLPRDLAPRDSGSRVPVEGWRFWWSEKRQWREKERERERANDLFAQTRCVARGREREREHWSEREEGGASRATTTSASFLRLPRLQTSLLRALNSHGGSKPPPTTKLPFQLSTGLSSEYSRTPASESSSAGKGGAGGAAGGGGSGASSSSAKPGAGRRVADADASVYAKYYVNQILQLGEEGIKGAWARVS